MVSRAAVTLENFNLKITQDISQEKLTALVFVNSWETFNQAVTDIFENIKKNHEFASKCNIHIIDMEKNFDTALNYNVAFGPAVVLFWKGKQLRIKRKSCEEDNKYVGITKTENYLHLLSAALENGPKLYPVPCE